MALFVAHHGVVQGLSQPRLGSALLHLRLSSTSFEAHHSSVWGVQVTCHFFDAPLISVTAVHQGRKIEVAVRDLNEVGTSAILLAYLAISHVSASRAQD